MTPAADGPRRPVTAGVVLGAVGRASVAVTGALTTILVARLLGAERAGDFAIAASIVFTLTLATTFGAEHGITFHVSAGRWDPRAAFGSAQRLALVSGLAGVAGALLVRLLVPSAFGGLSVASTVVAAAALPFSLAWFYMVAIALAIDRYEHYAVPPALQSAASLALVAVLAATNGIGGAVVGLALSHVLAAAYALAWGRRLAPGGSGDGEPRQLVRAVRFGVAGYSGNTLQLINMRVDLFILAGFASDAAVGHYSVALAVTSAMWLLPQAVGDVIFPRVAALSAEAGGDAERQLVEERSLRHTALAAAVVAAVLALASLVLIVPVYGPDFRAAIVPALILLPGCALVGLAGVLFASVVGRGHAGLSLATSLVVTPVTVVLYAVLIPTLKAEGAALASTLSYSLTFVLGALAYRRVTGRPVARALVPGRAELRDLRALGPAIAARLRGARA